MLGAIVDENAIREPFRYDTTPFGGFCKPNLDNVIFEELTHALEGMLEKFYQEIAGKTGAKIVEDIVNAYQVIALSCLTALIIGYLFLFFIRCVGGAVLYIFLILLELLLGLGGLYAYYYAEEYQGPESTKKYFTYGAYVLWGLCALEFISVCCCWKAIRIAIAVYKTTAQYVSSNLRIQLLPLFSWVILVVWGGVWTYSTAYVYTVGEVEQRAKPLEFLSDIKHDSQTRYILFYQLFALFWVSAMINSLC